MKKIGSINDASTVAERLDVLKLTYMSDLNPSYPLCHPKKAYSVKMGLSPTSTKQHSRE